MGKKKKGQTIMTYDEDMELQKKKYTELALLLDSFKNGFSGPDPTWDVPYPIRSAKAKWGRCNAYVENMTANKFFEYCRIAYIAAEEKGDHLDKSLSGREMYSRYADGRCGALLEIDPDSPEQFLAWLDHKVPCDHDLGDHPWEIKRGGNTTHIDLFVHRPHSYDWYKPGDEKYEKMQRTVLVGLRGHHIGRIVETVKMFLALHKAGLPILGGLSLADM